MADESPVPPLDPQALLARLAEAEHASEEKTRFIRHVSHEFRTPLSSIIGFTALLEREGEAMDARTRAEYLAIVLRNARHLLHVVNDLLNISKVEAGTLEVTLAPVRAAELAGAVVTALGPQAEARGVRIRLADEGARPALADSGRLRQVMFNLLENAIKYSPVGGEIVVRTREAEGETRVEVADEGPGIDLADQDRLFKEFSRVNPPGMRVVGAGLGLALSRMLTDAMGGRIGVDSAPGRGSTFWVALPVAGAAAGAAPVPSGAVAARARTETVAVVDDDGDIRAFAEAVLRRAGYRAVADAGTPGLGERLLGPAPALVLMDLHLAGRRGEEALAEVRAVPELDGAVVLSFTAGASADPNPPGFDGRVTKPVEPEALVAAVDAALEARAASGRVPGREQGAEEDDFLAPLRARFRAGLAGRLRDIEGAAADGGDRETLLRELHKLKGAAAGYGFDGLADGAADAEEAVRRGGGGAEVARLTRLLRSIVDAG
ncbi:ATP-binding response regulator [Longimicrobium sp.]|uniref:ATP-binding response regulator n=1 Tax=Longimicrobium sp. TaxID=2029185 RepID=UPI002E36A4C2|nr:ATP-binding protein [Longimicrobium sp.]HEX6037870.1 ATP-binding protein [Longimicrobium sp.]